MQLLILLAPICFVLTVEGGLPARKACVKTDTTLQSQSFDFEGIPGTIQRSVYGTMAVIDGCTFEMSNFTISPPCVNTYFYGVPAGQPGDLYARVVASAISSVFGTTLTLTLDNIQWGQMDGLIIYCEGEHKGLGKAYWNSEKQQPDPNSSMRTYGEGMGPWMALCMAIAFLMMSFSTRY